jgi:hypothetical protein
MTRKVLAMKKAATPLLNTVYVASPCNVDWSTMSGDDRVRFCGSCSKNVYNISDLSRADAEAFLQANGVSKCISLYRRKDGTIITDDCPVGLRKIRDRARAIARFAASIVGICLSFAAASAREPSKWQGPKEIVIVNDSPIHYHQGLFAFRGSIDLPPYAVLSTGKNALGDEVVKTEVDGKEQISLRERDTFTDGTHEKRPKSLTGSICAIDLPSTLTASEVFHKGIQYEQLGMWLTAESLYKITLKYFEQSPSEYQDDFKTSVVLRYAELLKRMHRHDEAAALMDGNKSVAATDVHTR